MDDLAYAIMYETTKLAYRVSEADVTRARNQVYAAPLVPLRLKLESRFFILIEPGVDNMENIETEFMLG